MPTIVAVATPAGNGGIGIVRLSGPGAKNLLSRVFLPRSRHFVNFRPWMLHHGVLLDADDEPLD
ncbi:MAG: tRNA uridine-5-carboxymethylaminomethyl(34) synthesis GTPase MnmE, partial [Desulfovibrio sp.]|nr:tRNA uridine-5-carboxymethylaminomethyl(34) synthesis GTPase MnmE [Desulfovibrio sp.]